MTAPLILPASPGWHGQALCAQIDTGDAFFPEIGGTGKRAKKVCAMCEVRTECLATAIENDEAHGIWGGMSPQQRLKLQKRRA